VPLCLTIALMRGPVPIRSIMGCPFAVPWNGWVADSGAAVIAQDA